MSNKAIKRLSKKLSTKYTRYAENLEKEDKRYAKQNQSASNILNHHFPRPVLFQNSTSKAIKMIFKICGEREKREKEVEAYRLEA